MLNIDLSSNQLYKTKSIILNQKTAFIYGKNGSGKSSFADLIKIQYGEEYNVQVFNGFEGILDKNRELNAVVLGKENNEINQIIKDKRNEIKKLEDNITLLNNEIIEPEQGKENLFTRKKTYEEDINSKQKEIDIFCTTSASEIKNLTKPQIASPTYNKKSFCEEIENAKNLSNDEIKKYSELIKSEVKNAPYVNFPIIDINKIIEETNDILSSIVEEEIKIDRLDNSEKRNFAKIGLELHKPGDICAFCGSTIAEKTINDLNSYFSAGKAKQLEEKRIAKIDDIKDIIENLTSFNISSKDFYSEYSDEINALSIRIEEKKKTIIKVLDLARSKLSIKNIFSISDTIDDFAIIDFDTEKTEYMKLVKSNNSSDLEKKQNEAKLYLRENLIYRYITEFNYKEKLAKVNEIINKKDEIVQQITNKEITINELKCKIDTIKNEIKALEKKTISETLLVDNIKAKLRSMVNFELVHVENDDNKGIYKVKSVSTGEIRDIDKLSKGEKNIVAFLYFLEKINELSDDIRKKIIVFDDPMTSNDDDMQYLIIEELLKLIKEANLYEYFILLTHNKHFYLNIGYGIKYKETERFHFNSDLIETTITRIVKAEDDFSTGYDSLWKELKFLFYNDEANADLMLNPIRRIIDTFVSFNSLKRSEFFNKVPGSKKLFDVNSHEIYDLQANENGKTKEEIIEILKRCFAENGSFEHFERHWISD